MFGDDSDDEVGKLLDLSSAGQYILSLVIHQSLHVIQVFAKSYAGISWHCSRLLSKYTKYVTFCFSDLSWRESTERSCQKKDDEAGERNLKKFLMYKCFMSFLCDLHFSGPCLFVILLCLKTRLEMQKALEEDSTVYDYDAVYDDIQNQRLESNKKILHGTDKRVFLFMLNTCIAARVDPWVSQ